MTSNADSRRPSRHRSRLRSTPAVTHQDVTPSSSARNVRHRTTRSSSSSGASNNHLVPPAPPSSIRDTARIPTPGNKDEAYDEYMAERAFVESSITDDDREFDIEYLSYAYGCNEIADLYDPQEFDADTRLRFLKWIQHRIGKIKDEVDIEALWNDSFFHYHNVEDMYIAWEQAT